MGAIEGVKSRSANGSRYTSSSTNRTRFIVSSRRKCFALALVAAFLWTWRVRPTDLEAAVGIDRGLGLQERISSALAIGEQDTCGSLTERLAGLGWPDAGLITT